MGIETLVLLSMGFTLTVHGQLSLILRWNGTLVSESPTHRDDRVLIYHDEIAVRTNASGGVPDGPGVLVCKYSGTGGVAWLSPSSDTPIQSNNDNNLRIIRSIHSDQDSGRLISRVQLARTSSISQITSNEGLWECNSGDLRPLYVAIYERGNGGVETNVVTLQYSSLNLTLITFTLVGNTTGGPPTTALWLRNDEALDNSAHYNISTHANPSNTLAGRVNAHYSSTLTITGTLPGIYEYRASNKATIGDRRGSFTLEGCRFLYLNTSTTFLPKQTSNLNTGGTPTNLKVTLTGNNTIQVSWTPPEIPPSGGYRIVDVENGLDRLVPSSPQELVLPPGDYNIQVNYTSQHFPGGSVGPLAVTVRGILPPIIFSVLQPTATVIIFSWTQPPFSFSSDDYQLTLTRITESSQQYCNSFADSRSKRANGRLMSNFTNLQEFSIYNIRLTAQFHIAGNSFSTFAEIDFTTPSSAPSGVPENIVYGSSPTSVIVSWDEIECIHQNGLNIRYEVNFRQLEGDGAIVTGTVNERVFRSNRLEPLTVHIFRVRGVNDAGAGDYTQPIIIITDEKCNVGAESRNGTLKPLVCFERKQFKVYLLFLCGTIYICLEKFDTDEYGEDIAISVALTFLLTSSICAIVVLVGCLVYCSRSHQIENANPVDLNDNMAYVQHNQESGSAESINCETLYDHLNR